MERFLANNNIYMGDIMMIIKKNKDSSYEKVLAKSNAILINFNENKFIDIDAVNEKNITYIEFLLSNNVSDNIILKEEVENPYVGQLYLENVEELYKSKVSEIKRLILK